MIAIDIYYLSREDKLPDSILCQTYSADCTFRLTHWHQSQSLNMAGAEAA